MHKKSAFTIMEIIVVVVIIGVLAALAIPSYRIQMLKMKNQEAVRVLMAVWEAQKDYKRDNGNYTNTIANLAIDIPVSKNFNAPVLYDQILGGPVATCGGGNPKAVAAMSAKDFSYTLWAGEIGCIGCSSVPASLCPQMGFQ